MRPANPAIVKTPPAGKFDNVAQQAATDFRTPGKDFINPFIASSPNSEAYVIATWCLYHAGKLPSVLAPSRGYTWRGYCPGLGAFKSTVRNAADHREGVERL